MIHIVKALAVLVLLALHIPVSAHANSTLDDLIVGSELIGRLKIGMVTVPLPPGAWTVVNVNERQDSDLHTFAGTDLIQFVDGKIVGTLNISTNLDTKARPPGWRPHNECSRKNAWFVRNDANYDNDQRCWIINHAAIPQTSKYIPTRGGQSSAMVDQP